MDTWSLSFLYIVGSIVTLNAHDYFETAKRFQRSFYKKLNVALFVIGYILMWYAFFIIYTPLSTAVSEYVTNWIMAGRIQQYEKLVYAYQMPNGSIVFRDNSVY
jgi:hypothetical protein